MCLCVTVALDLVLPKLHIPLGMVGYLTWMCQCMMMRLHGWRVAHVPPMLTLVQYATINYQVPETMHGRGRQGSELI